MLNLPQYPVDLPLVITSYDVRFCGVIPGLALTAGDAAPVTGGTGYFFNLTIPWAYPIARVGWINGSGVSGTVDVGFYNRSLNKIATIGPTSQSGTSATQWANLNLLLPAGSYLWGIVPSTTSTRLYRAAPATQTAQQSGIIKQASVSTLPSSIVPVTSADAYLPIFAMTLTTSGF